MARKLPSSSVGGSHFLCRAQTSILYRCSSTGVSRISRRNPTMNSLPLYDRAHRLPQVGGGPLTPALPHPSYPSSSSPDLDQLLDTMPLHCAHPTHTSPPELVITRHFARTPRPRPAGGHRLARFSGHSALVHSRGDYTFPLPTCTRCTLPEASRSCCLHVCCGLIRLVADRLPRGGYAAHHRPPGYHPSHFTNHADAYQPVRVHTPNHLCTHAQRSIRFVLTT